MDQSLTSTGSTAPPSASTSCITLGQIPRYVELYRKTGKPPRVNVLKPWRFDRIDLTTRERWVLKLSDGRAFLLKPGTNPFDPPVQLEAGAWFVIHMAARASGRVRLPNEGLSGWIDEDDLFDSLLSPDDQNERDELVAPEGAPAEPALPELRAFDEGAEPSGPFPAPVEHPVVSASPPTAAPSPTFTFGRSPRSEGLLARIRRRVCSRAAA